MNDVVKNLQQVRKTKTFIEDLLKKAKQGKTQIFISFKVGTEGEVAKEVQISDWGNGDNEINHSTEIYNVMLSDLKKQEDFWLRCAESDLKELAQELNK